MDLIIFLLTAYCCFDAKRVHEESSDSSSCSPKHQCFFPTQQTNAIQRELPGLYEDNSFKTESLYAELGSFSQNHGHHKLKQSCSSSQPENCTDIFQISTSGKEAPRFDQQELQSIESLQNNYTPDGFDQETVQSNDCASSGNHTPDSFDQEAVPSNDCASSGNHTPVSFDQETVPSNDCTSSGNHTPDSFDQETVPSNDCTSSGNHTPDSFDQETVPSDDCASSGNRTPDSFDRETVASDCSCTSSDSDCPNRSESPTSDSNSCDSSGSDDVSSDSSEASEASILPQPGTSRGCDVSEPINTLEQQHGSGGQLPGSSQRNNNPKRITRPRNQHRRNRTVQCSSGHNRSDPAELFSNLVYVTSCWEQFRNPAASQSNFAKRCKW